MPKAGNRPRYIGTMKIKSRRIQQNQKFHIPDHQASAGKPPERREPGPIGINNAYKVPTCLSISTTERRKRCEFWHFSILMAHGWRTKLQWEVLFLLAANTIGTICLDFLHVD